MGERATRLQDHANKQSRANHRYSAARVGTWTNCATVDFGKGRIRCASVLLRFTRRLESRRHAARRREYNRITYCKHRLRRNGSRYTSHESYAVSSFLPGKADVFS